MENSFERVLVVKEHIVPSLAHAIAVDLSFVAMFEIVNGCKVFASSSTSADLKFLASLIQYLIEKDGVDAGTIRKLVDMALLESDKTAQQ